MSWIPLFEFHAGRVFDILNYRNAKRGMEFESME